MRIVTAREQVELLEPWLIVATVPNDYEVRPIDPFDLSDEADFGAGLFRAGEAEPLSALAWRSGGELAMIQTHPDHRRHGYASMLFDHVQQNVDPSLRHSDALTDEGAAWQRYMKGRTARVAKLPKKQKCEYCSQQATKRILHSEGMAYIPTCDKHLKKGKDDAARCLPGQGLDGKGDYDETNIVRIDDIPEPKKKKAAADYRGEHQAPVNAEEGAPMHDLSGTYPDDFYEHSDWYADGEPYDDESLGAIHSVRGRPKQKVTVYRTLPLDARDPSKNRLQLNTGDWVTPSLAYAKEHGQNNMGHVPWTILKQKVPAAHLFTDGNSVNEWGYGGPGVPATEHPWAGARRRKQEKQNTPVTPELMQDYVRHYFRSDDEDANTEFANQGWKEFNKRVESGEFKPTYDATPKNKMESFPGTDHIYDMFAEMHSQRGRTAMAAYEEYAGHHQAPGPGTGFPIHDMTGDDYGGGLGGVPEDWYTHPHYYSSGETSPQDTKRVQRLYQQTKGKPEQMVDVYRALPHGNTDFNTGDWVTPSLEYARQHAMHPDDPSQDLPVIKTKVPAKHLWQNGDSYFEFGYHGPSHPGKIVEGRKMTAAVTVYTKPACPQCMATTRHLKKNNIPFEAVDLTQDPNALAHAKSLGYSSAPVVLTEEDHWSGYRPDRIDQLG